MCRFYTSHLRQLHAVGARSALLALACIALGSPAVWARSMRLAEEPCQ